MPDMNGIELLRAAREFLPDIGVVLMTAFATVDTAREAFKLGADDFIQKPFDVEELKIIVKKALERQALITKTALSNAPSASAAASKTSSGIRTKCRPFIR
jgi:DNA-binding NtrC family response regulator